MFDKAYVTVQEAPRGPSHVTVHEHRAPTDESIKLYDEMLKKARAEIISQIAAPHDNVLSHATVQANYNCATLDVRCLVVFKLNGREHKLKIKVDDDPRERMIEAIVGELCKELGRSFEKQIPALGRR